VKRLYKWQQKYWWVIELTVFLLLSIGWVSPWLFTGKTIMGSDLTFHLNRIQGIYAQMKLSGNWWQIPSVATSSFLGWGYPINLFYPAFMLMPAAWLQFLVWGGRGFYLFLALVTFGTFEIAALVARKLLNSRIQGFLVALVYGLSQYRLIDFFVRGALGEGIVFALYPHRLLWRLLHRVRGLSAVVLADFGHDVGGADARVIDYPVCG